MKIVGRMMRITGFFTLAAQHGTKYASCQAFTSTSRTNSHMFSFAFAFARSNNRSSKTSSAKHGSSLHSTSKKESIPDEYPRLDIVKHAISAIRKASRITTHLQPGGDSNVSGITKKDASPVTIGDFAAQAIVLKLLETQRKDDIFIAEESSSNLSDDLSDEIMNVLDLCGLKNEDVIGDVEELKRCIDMGQSYKKNGELLDSAKEKLDEKNRVWCLDPIDGTRGFLRGKREGGQYCIALALIENGTPIMGILGCPNLPASPSDENYAWMGDESEENNQSSRGCIFVASKGGGCYQLPLYPPDDDGEGKDDIDRSTVGATKVQVTANDGKGNIPLSGARFCVGVESYSDPEGKVTAIAKTIHGELDEKGDILHTRRMDSQVKYGVVARGGAEYVTRLPKKEYVEWIWDHASGRIVIEEAGGTQTDTNGGLINYGLGAKMDKDVDGILISSGGAFHDSLLSAYEKQEKERSGD